MVARRQLLARAVLIAVLFAFCGAVAPAATVSLDASTQVVQVDNDGSGVNNCLRLIDNANPVTVTASGNAQFGSQPGEFWNSALVAYRDALGHVQYASSPMNNAGGVTISGTHYDYAMLTDIAGGIPGNTGTCNVSEIAMGPVVATSGTIFAGSTTRAQTGVAEVSPANAAFLDTMPPTPENFLLTVTGSAFYGPGANDQYGSVALMYRDPGNGISYASQAIGTSQNYFGFRFRIFITDFVNQTGDDSGNLQVTLTQVPEPMSMGATALAALALLRRRMR